VQLFLCGRFAFFKVSMRLIAADDFRDIYFKIKQRGWSFFLSKFHPVAKSRAKSAFNTQRQVGADWWDIPAVNRRWNQLITGDPETSYHSMIVQDLLAGERDLSMLSLGCGQGHNEFLFAEYDTFNRIVGLDIAENSIAQANEEASRRDYSHLSFQIADVNELVSKGEKYDVVLFNASLHHFKNVDNVLRELVPQFLKKNGYVIVNEYVGPDRNQFSQEQIDAINLCIQKIPDKYLTRFKTNAFKRSFSGPGILRMILADPSECVDSSNILPAFQKHYTPVLFRPYGGNIAPYVLKDITHHFINETLESLEVLEMVFRSDDEWMQNHPSDYIFGVYQFRQ
jgi:ubiquinone/menaquinone biosynthesis C-methylase UbiE